MVNTQTTDKTLRLVVITPMKVIYDRRVSMFIARTKSGDVGVLYGHENYSAVLADWPLRIVEDGQSKSEALIMVLGGILTVCGNEAVIISEMAEYPDKLQTLIEKIKSEHSENKVKEQSADLQMQRMEFAIRQALVKIDVSAYSVIKDGMYEE